MAILLLVPTPYERQRLTSGWAYAGGALELCGFGPVAAAARTAGLLAVHRPDRVVLAGIAGTYDDDRLAVGQAAVFDAVAIEGIGAGSGANHRTAASLGFPQWEGEEGRPSEGRPSEGRPPIGDRLALDRWPDRDAESDDETGGGGRLLLTCCAASATPDEASVRAQRHGALAEDMEGFGVAFACALAKVPLTIVRGVSNRAGNRDRRAWRIDAALEAARALVRQLLAE